MFTLGWLRRRLYSDGQQRDVDMAAETVTWLPAQQHDGHNIGNTATRGSFVELREQGPEHQGLSTIGSADT